MKPNIYKIKKFENGMFKRLFAYFLAIITSLQIAFSVELGFIAKPFVSVFGETGIFGILKNEFAVAGIIFISMLIGFFNIFKMVLTPVFGSHTKERNVVAFCISIIGNSGLVFFFTNEGVKGYIALFGGSIGLILLLIIFSSLIYTVDKFVTQTSERFSSKKWWLWISLAVFIGATVFIGVVTLVYDDFEINWLLDFLTSAQAISGLIFLIALILFFMGRKKVNERRDINEDNPDILKSKKLLDKLSEKSKSIDKRFVNIKKEL